MNIIVNHILKPKRVLYYIQASEQNKKDYYAGIVPDELMKYDGAFGTYDSPGLFKIRKDDKWIEVIGIEYRPDDKEIEYPEGLECMNLDSDFFMSSLLTLDHVLDDDLVDECVEYVKHDDSACAFDGIIHPDPDPDIIQVCTLNNQNRIFSQAGKVTSEEFFKTDYPENEKEKALYDIAYHDFITHYYNWSYINPIIAGFYLKGIQDFAFVHFDIKDFNAINVIYGHGVGNKVLIRVTEMMERQDWVYYAARCHNDNFAMMIKDMSIEETRQKLLDMFSELAVLEEDKRYNIYFRCGVVTMKKTLLLSDRVADGAKHAQGLGVKLNETEITFYTDSMHDEVVWAKKIKAYVSTAIDNDEFLVYLQPKYDVETEKIEGAEALVRWMYRGKQMLAPFKFIPFFEKDGTISKIDDIVLNKVCGYLKKWKEDGLPLYPVSVNLSRKRMENPNLIEHLIGIVDSYGVDHSLIDFELTESAAYNNQEYMISIISKLKSAGFRISMDDFGTGFSSLSLLTMMPLDTLKIDKSFVDGIGSSEENYKDCAVIKHIISMARALDLNCLAEGAEEKSQVEKLREFGCEYIQGYYFSKPVPVEEYEEKLRLN